MALTWHHFPTVPDRASRVRIFLRTYGGLPAFDVAEAIAARMEVTMAMELALAEAGGEPQRTWVAEGCQAWAAGEARWVYLCWPLLRPGSGHGLRMAMNPPALVTSLSTRRIVRKVRSPS